MGKEGNGVGGGKGMEQRRMEEEKKRRLRGLRKTPFLGMEQDQDPTKKIDWIRG